MEPHAACKAAVNWIKSRASIQTHNLFILVNNSVQILANQKNVESGLPCKGRKIQKSVSNNDEGSRVQNRRRKRQ